MDSTSHVDAEPLSAKVLSILKDLPESVKDLIAATIRDDSRAKKPMPNYRHKPAEREELRLEVVQLDAMGFPRSRIARELGIDLSTVYNWLAEAKKEFVDSIVDFRKDVAIKELHVLLAVRQRAYDALTRAERGTKSSTHRHGFGDKGQAIDEWTETETEVLPPSQYMSVILQTNARICTMFDVDEAAAQLNVNVQAITGAAMVEALTAHAAARTPSKLDQLERLEAEQKSTA